MFKKNENIYFYFILFIISTVLLAAFIIEHGLGYQPCKLCVYERIPYFLSIFLLLEIIFLKKNIKITLLLLLITFVISTVLALYHLGIEQGLITESFACKSEISSQSLSKEQLLETLKQNIKSCKDVDFKLFGFSLASINAIFSLAISVIFFRLFLNYGKN